MATPEIKRPPVGMLLRFDVTWRNDDFADVETERVGKHGEPETWRGVMSAAEVAEMQAEARS